MAYIVYDYHCPECQITMERMVLSSEKDAQVCEQGHKMTREMPAPEGRVSLFNARTVRRKR